MINDLELMKDITPLFDRKLIVWGIGKIGPVIIEDIKDIGAGKAGIFLCDSNCKLWGEEVSGNRILSPDELQREVSELDLKDFMVLVTALSVSVQDEIIECIKKRLGDSVDICTRYAIEWGMYLNVKHSRVESEYSKRKLVEYKQNNSFSPEVLRKQEETLRYFALLPIHDDEIILIYQPAKVGSSSIYKSIKNHNRYALHCHTLLEAGEGSDDLYRLLNLKSGKIISLVREPVARRISEMWQGIVYTYRYDVGVNFSDVEKWYFDGEFWNTEFEWFYQEMKTVFKIDVFEHPFDKEKGYSLIKQGNIELLLIKMEKLNELEDVIGEFLDIDGFQLSNENIGKRKAYRYAFQSYKENFTFAKEKCEDIYKKN
ncbi:MAG: putative capsular polysaccharide synthesis family protein [Lachnospiraceae bacterium]|nr:putative capsular polysaccharide synthesis family protein [Lachnospiraceae bacterium]